MALTAIDGIYYGTPLWANLSYNSGLVIDATGEKLAFMGRVWNKDRAQKQITKVGFRFGTVTKAGGSGLTVSLQNVSTAAGPPAQPDETQDQTVAVANGDATFASNTYHHTGALSANRTVEFGELLSVVVEYDGSGRLGADSVIVSGINGYFGSAGLHECHCALKTGGSWALANFLPNVVLEFSDGTFGTLDGAYGTSNITSTTVNTGTTPDEAGFAFTVPVPMKIDALVFPMIMVSAANQDYDVVFYTGSTATATVSILAEHHRSGGGVAPLIVPIGEQELATATTYRAVIKPSSANSVTVYYFDVSAAGHMEANMPGTTWTWTQRTDSGAFSETTTRRMWGGIRVIEVHDGASSGGGGNKVYGG
jgi:hypothetical protein